MVDHWMSKTVLWFFLVDKIPSLEPCITPYLSHRTSTGSNPEKGTILGRETIREDRWSSIDLIDGFEDPWSFRHESPNSISFLIGVAVIVILLNEV